MATDCGAWDACMMDEKDGTGDGAWGNMIWVMGTPVVGGGAWDDAAPEPWTDGWDAS